MTMSYPSPSTAGMVVVVSRLTRAAALVFCIAVLASCKVDADVTVTLDDDGTGSVSTVVALDAEAVGRVETNGRTLDTAFPLDDLTEAGWEITPWERSADGAATLRLEHGARARTSSGNASTTSSVRRACSRRGLRRDRGLLRSHDELTLAVDLSRPGTGIQQDPELVAALQGSGLDVATLDQQLQAQLRESLTLSLTLVGPDGKETTVEMLPGGTRNRHVRTSRFESGPVVWFAIAGMLAFLGALLYLAASVGARHERARQPVAEPDRTPLM